MAGDFFLTRRTGAFAGSALLAVQLCSCAVAPVESVESQPQASAAPPQNAEALLDSILILARHADLSDYEFASETLGLRLQLARDRVATDPIRAPNRENYR